MKELDDRSKTGGRKYEYEGATYATGEAYTALAQYVPFCVNKEHVFLGWFDKRGEGTKKEGNTTIYYPSIFQPGAGAAYHYTDETTQTIDAIWISVNANEIDVFYDGKPHVPDRSYKLSVEGESGGKNYEKMIKDTLKEQYQQDIDNIPIESVYSIGPVSNHTMPAEGFVEAGTYNLTHTFTINVGVEKLASKNTKVIIRQRPVSVDGEGTYVYNGDTQTLTIQKEMIGTATEGNEGLLEGHKLTLIATLSGKDVGTYVADNDLETTNKDFDSIQIEIKDEKGQDVTNNYAVSVTGTLNITPADGAGSVQLEDWTYGDPESKEDSSVTVGKDEYQKPTYYYKKADDDTYTEEKPTDAGDYVVKAVWAATKNYNELTATDAFTIKPRKITVSKTERKRHDKNDALQTMTYESGYDLEEGTLVEGDDLTVTAEVSGGPIGEYPYASSAEGKEWSVKNASGKDVSDNYDITVSGILYIDPAIYYVLNGKTDTATDKFIVENSKKNPDSYRKGETFSFESPIFGVKPTNAGTETQYYKFLGWYTDPGFSEKSIRKGILSTDTEDITVYAKWEAVGRVYYYLYEENVDFKVFAKDVSWDIPADQIESSGSDGNGQYVDIVKNYTNPKRESVLKGTSTFRLPATDPVRKGYAFKGWKKAGYLNGQTLNDKENLYEFPYDGNYNPETGKPDSLTLRAQWEPYTYSVVFDENIDGTAGGSDETKTQQFTYDTEAKLNKNGTEGSGAAIAGYTRAGYTLAGWARTPNAAKAEYHDGDKVLNWKIGNATEIAWETEEGKADRVADEKTLTLYAVWEPYIQVTLKGYEGVYDGDTHKATYTGTMDGDTVSFYTRSGETKKSLTEPVQAKNVNDSVHDIYMDVTRAGKTATFGPVDVIITKRPIEITSGSGEKEYDGTPLTNSTVTAEKTTEGRGWVSGEGADYAATGSQTPVGSSKNKFTVAPHSGTDLSNYEIIRIEGTLTVVRAAGAGTVTLDDWTYGDPAPEEVPSVTVGKEEYKEPTYYYKKAGEDDDRYTEEKPTDAGDYVVKAVWDETDNYQGFSATGEFKILKRMIRVYREETRVHVADETQVMNITADDIEKGSSMATGDVLTIVNAKISGEEIGTYEKAEFEGLSWSVNHEGTDVSENYELTISGKLTILPSVTYVLNGKTKSPYSVKNSTENPDSYTPGETQFTFRAPTYEITDENNGDVYHYVFLGWYTQNIGGTQRPGITLSDKEDITVYARWRAEGRVRYWLHGSDDKEVVSWELGEDAGRIQPDNPTSSTGYKGPYYIDSDYYNGNTKNEKTVYGKADFRIPEAVPVRTGYVFDHWYTESANNNLYNQELKPGESYEFPYSGSLSKSGKPNTFTMHAYWIPYSYSAKFHENADGAMDVVKTENFTYGEEGMLGNVSFTRAGYTFEGWAASPNGPVLFKEAIPVLNWAAGTSAKPGLVKWEHKNGASVDLYAIWKPKFEVTVTGFNEVYDGQPHAVEVDGTIAGDVVTYSYMAGGSKQTVTSKVKATNVSESVGSVTVTVTRGKEEYKETVEAIIRKRPVTLESADLTKEFDGSPLVNGDTSLVQDGEGQPGQKNGWVEGEGLDESRLVFDGTITLPGTVDNTFRYTLTDQTREGNYEITPVYGTLEVTNRAHPYEITVKANSGTKTYDGTTQSVSGFESLSFMVEGHTYTVTGLEANGSGRNAGDYKVVVSGSARVLNEAKQDVTAQFTVRTVEGKLTIRPRALTLTSADDAKTYDGTPLTNSNVTVSAPGFAKGDGASYKVTGTQTLEGQSKNTFEYTLNTGTLAQNYEITKVEGTLTVLGAAEKFPIIAEAKNDTLMYDGKFHTLSGLLRDTFEFNGQKYTLKGLSATVSGKDAGTYTVKVTGTPVVLDAKGNDVTAQFAVSTKDGALEITRRKVVLESGSATKKYTGDGKALTSPGVTVTGDGFVEGEASPTATGSITYVGEVDNTIDIGAKSGYKEENYTIEKKEGTLRVTDGTATDPVDPKQVVTKTHEVRQYKVGEKVSFTVTVKNIYNETKTITLSEQEGVVFSEPVSGKYPASLGDGGRTATFADVPSGEQVTITATYTVTDAAVKNGSFTNRVTARFSGVDKSFTGSDTVAQIDRSCTYMVKFADRSSGRELRDPIGPVTAGYGTVISENTRGTDEIQYKNIKIAGYQYVTSSGNLTVTTDTDKNVLTLYYEPDLSSVLVKGFDVTYDGKRHTIRVTGATSDDEITYSYEVDGETRTVTSPVSAVNVAESAGSVTVTVKRGGTMKTYTVPAVIRKRKVELLSMDLSKEFDGEPLTNGDAPLEKDGHADPVEKLGPDEGWVDGEGFSSIFYGEITWPGSCDNAFECELTSNTEAENYDIKTEFGTLKISNRTAPYEVTVEANSGTFTYDGIKKTVSGLKGEMNGVLRFMMDGHAYIITGLSASAVKTDAGTYTVEISGKERIEAVENRGTDLKKQFTVTKLPGTLEIDPRPVTLKSGSSVKEYDGTPLRNSSVTATGFVGSDGATCTTTGSRTLPGSSANSFTYTLNKGTNAKNYIITKQEGTLKVTDRAQKYQIKVRAKSATYTYDGTQKTVSGFESLSFTVNGKKYTVEGLTAAASGKDVKTGGYPVTPGGTAKVLDESGNDVTAQFNVTAEAGVLTIKKRPVTLRSADKMKQYDGSPLVNGATPLLLDGTPDRMEVLGAEEGWVDGEGIDTCTFTASQTEKGSTPNEFRYTLMEGTLEDNYEITRKYGKLTVIDRDEKYQITVRAKSAAYTYDGTQKTVSGFESLSFDVNGEIYTVTGLTAETTAKNAGSYTVAVQGTAKVLDSLGVDVTEQFHVLTEAGVLKINKRSVKLKSADLEKTYDGTPLTNGNTPLAQDGYPDEEFAGVDEGWADGEGIVLPCEFSESQTSVGSTENKFTCTLLENTDLNNYDIQKEYGMLTVTARTEKYEIDVTAASGEFLYDGTEKTVSGFAGATEAAGGGLAYELNGHIYTVRGLSASASATDVKAGGYLVKVDGTATVWDADGNEVTGDFTVHTHEGLLTISPRRVLLSSASSEKKYDGLALSEPEVVVEGDGFAAPDGETPEASAVATGSIIYVGSTENTVELTKGSSYKDQNYIISVNEGVLTVTDGTAASPLNPALVVNKTHDGDKVYEAGDTVTFTVEATNIYNEEKTLILTELEGVTFAVKASGTYQPTLGDEGRTATFEKVAPGETVEIEAVYTVTDDDVKKGSFANDVTVEFSGPEKTFHGRDTVDEIDRECSYIVRFVDLDAMKRRMPGDLREEIGPIMVKYGTVVDGETTAGNVIAGGQSTIDVEVPYCEIEIPGYQFEGTSDPLTVTTNTEENVFFVYYTWDSSQLSAKGVDKTYDGEESSVTVAGTMEGDKVTYSYTVVENGEEKTVETDTPPTLKDVADSLGEVTVTVKRGERTWTKTVPATITARRVTLQSADLSKKYDGQPLVNGNTPLVLDGIADDGEPIPEDEGWAKDDSVSYRFTGSQTTVGASANSFEVIAGEGTDLSNYAIDKKEGTLTVTAADPVQTKPEPEPETKAPTTGAKLTVKKSIVSESNGHLLGLKDAKFYVALFSDAKLTKLAGDIQELNFSLDTAVARVTYRNLKPGTYYVAEVNAKGKPMKSGKYGGGAYVAKYEGDAQKVTIAKDAGSVRFSFENQFLEFPDAQYYRDLGLPKDQKDEESRSGSKSGQSGDPESGAQANGTGAVGAGEQAAKTGDETPIEWMLLLLAASGMLLILAERRRRKARV